MDKLKIENVVFSEKLPVESAVFVEQLLEKALMEQLSIHPLFRGKLINLEKGSDNDGTIS